MAQLTLLEAIPLFTQTMVEFFDEQTPPPSFLMSFFRNKFTDSKNVSTITRRSTEFLAQDRLRGTEGGRNQFSNKTHKIFTPPYYREYFDMTEIDVYDLMMSGRPFDEFELNVFTEEMISRIQKLQNLIMRSYEFQAAQVFRNGTIAVNAGDDFNFERRANSMVNLSSVNGYWTQANSTPLQDLEDAGTYMRNVGKVIGMNEFILVLPQGGFELLMDNQDVKDRFDNRRADLGMVDEPQMNAAGGTFHGMLSAGSYRFQIWSYTEIYEQRNPDGTITQEYYLPTNTAFVIPQNRSSEFCMSHAKVPQLPGNQMAMQGFPQIGRTVDNGRMYISDYVDPRASQHILDIKSAGLAIPVAVDKIYTMTITG